MNRKVVHSVFDYIADNAPAKIAIEENGREINYLELNKYSNRIAHCLLEQKVDKGDVVGLFLNSSINYIASILGINKAGGIFMPLDTNYPIQRLEFILNQVRPKTVITTWESIESLRIILSREGLSNLCETIIILSNETSPLTIENKVGSFNKWHETSKVGEQVDGNDSNYLLYTSGSTGIPKAIEGKHSGLSHFIHWEISEFKLSSDLKVSQLAPLMFDVSLRDIFVPLLTGGTLCIPEKEIKADPAKLIRWMGEKGITLTHMVPSVFRLMIKELQESQQLRQGIKSLEYILLAGEALYGRDISAWREFGTSAALVNLYGPSETTLAKIFNRINGQIFEPGSIVPLGQPITNTIIIIIKNNKLCEPGQIGEIFIKTPFRSKGYYKNSDLTSKFFVQNPLHNDYEDILYKTGDLGKYLPDRSITYIGRQDSQIKIRGNRVELSEVEKTISNFEGIEQTVVLPIQKSEGDHLLVCYYTQKTSIEVDKLRNYIGRYLPDYMHPSFYLPLQEFPLNINGKLDKSALPKPEDLLYERTVYLPPGNLLEEKLCLIWSEVLGLKKVGINNTFFELGGHSLRATKVISRIYKEIGKEISLKEFFENSSISKLSALLSKTGTTTFKAIEPLPYQEYYDISHAQKRLWILDQIEEDRTAYNISSAYTLEGNLNKDVFQRTLKEIIKRHESLRTTFIVVGGKPKQKIWPIAEFKINFEFLDLMSEKESEAKVKELANIEESIPFNLETGPLLRFKLLQSKETKYVILFTMHHIISDGWSMKVFTDEFFNIYHAFNNNTEYSLPPVKIQYKDFAHWQNNILSDDDSNIHDQYWLNKFRGEVPCLNLITDFPRPVLKTYNGNRIFHLIEKDKFESIIKINNTLDASLFMFLIASVKLLLYRYTNESDIIIGSPIAGRSHADLENQIGFYVNTLALRTQFTGGESFRDFLIKVRKEILDAYDHQIYPFDKLVERLEIPRDMSRSPLFDVVVVLQDTDSSQSEISEIRHVEIDRYRIDSKISKFDLTFSFAPSPQGLSLHIEYNTDLFSEKRINQVISHFQNLISSIIKDMEAPINRLEFITEEERRILLSKDRAMVSFPENKTIQALFEDQVLKTPNATAIVFEGKSITYKDLNERANQLAHYLRENNFVHPGDFIGLMMHRSEIMIVALLAILKSGGAYVALDPTYPEERIKYILEDTSVKALILEDTSFLTKNKLIDYPYVSLYDQWHKIGHFSKENPVMVNRPQDLAYVIYTSGSTGYPKGVMIEHRNVVQLFFNDGFQFSFSQNDTWTLFHSINFDFSVWEIFGALLFGGKLIVISKEVAQSPDLFFETLLNEGVTVLNQVPTMFKNLIPALTSEKNKDLKLRYIIFGGEALSPSILDSFHSLYPQVELINMYGITETTVHTTIKKIGTKEIESGLSNIGMPLPSAKLYILDRHHQLVPENTVGEIVVGGTGLARGYLNQEELTNEKFISDLGIDDGRLYLSGDLGLRLPNGEIVYKGRKDHQIKLRGFRIEAGEIENALLSHPSIEDVIVEVKESGQDIKHLTAYLVSHSDLKTNDLRKFLSERIPEYMIPSHFVVLNSFPLTSSGKVDRKRLQDTEDLNFEGKSLHLPPSNLLETILVNAFEEILGRKNISIDDNFFSLGGDSIKAIQIASKMNSEGYKLTVRDIFQNPAIIELASIVKKLDRIIDQSDVCGIIPLTPIQKQFFTSFKNKYEHYNQAGMLYSKEGFDYNATLAVFNKIQEHHDILRATYKRVDGKIIQRNNEVNFPLSVKLFDLRSDSNYYEKFCKNVDNIQSGIDLENGPLLNLGLFKLPDGDRLLIVIHHLVVDGVSWRILLEDIGILYQQYNDGNSLMLQQKTDSFKSWSEKLYLYANSPAFLYEKDYWGNIVSHSFLHINQDFKESSNYVKDTRSISFSLDEAETDLLLTKVNAAFNTEINDILLSSLGLAINEIFGLEKALIALEGHGREEVLKDMNISRTVGWFTSVFPILLDLSHKDDLSRQIMEVKESLRKIPNKGIGYGILKYLTENENKAEINLEISPQISFNYLGQFDTDEKKSSFELTNEYKGSTKSINEAREYEFDVSGMISNGRLGLSIEYNSRHYKNETIQRLGESYFAHLSRIINHCSSIEKGLLTPSDLGFKDLTIQDLETFFD